MHFGPFSLFFNAQETRCNSKTQKKSKLSLAAIFYCTLPGTALFYQVRCARAKTAIKLQFLVLFWDQNAICLGVKCNVWNFFETRMQKLRCRMKCLVHVIWDQTVIFWDHHAIFMLPIFWDQNAKAKVQNEISGPCYLRPNCNFLRPSCNFYVTYFFFLKVLIWPYSSYLSPDCIFWDQASCKSKLKKSR